MPRRAWSFWLKAALAVALVGAGDILFFEQRGVGLSLGIFSFALVAAFALTNPAFRRHRLSAVALLVALAFAALQVERPTLIGWLLFAVAIAVAALAPRAARGEDSWRWAQRLAWGGLKALVGPLADIGRVLAARARTNPARLGGIILGALLPVAGGAMFLALFVIANPVIEDAVRSFGLAEADPGRLMFWIVLALPAWAIMRPRGLRRTFAAPGLAGEADLPGVTVGSVAASLAIFNVLFAIQNGLDMAFLWSGAGLPQGVTFAEYAHRGAYPLVGTALLAGLFVLMFLRPGSRTADAPAVRLLVIVWVAQNLFLVASTALRTIDYVEAYSLTRLRIAALLWMGLVGVGLALILWRLLRGKSSSWLVNANVLAAALVLAGCSVVDLGAVAAAWNVRHAREVGGKGVNLDLCYMRQLNGAAVVSLAELEQRRLSSDFRDEVALARRQLAARMAHDQDAWRTWRWRDARRLAQVQALTREPFLQPTRADGDCYVVD